MLDNAVRCCQRPRMSSSEDEGLLLPRRGFLRVGAVTGLAVAGAALLTACPGPVAEDEDEGGGEDGGGQGGQGDDDSEQGGDDDGDQGGDDQGGDDDGD